MTPWMVDRLRWLVESLPYISSGRLRDEIDLAYQRGFEAGREERDRAWAEWDDQRTRLIADMIVDLRYIASLLAGDDDD